MLHIQVLRAGEVDTVGLVRLHRVIDDDAVGNADVRTDRVQEAVGQVRAVQIALRGLAVGLGADDDVAAVLRIVLDRRQLVSGVNARAEVAAVERNGQDDHSVLLQGLVGEFALLDEFRHDAVVRAVLDEVAHVVGVAAGNVEVAVAVVDTDLDQLFRLIDLLLHGSAALEFLVVVLAVEDDLDLLFACDRTLVLELEGLGAAGRDDGLVLVDVDGLDDGLVALVVDQVEDDLLELVFVIGSVFNGRGDGLFLADDAQSSVGVDVRGDRGGDADPDGSGAGDVAVSLSDLDVVVGLGVLKLFVDLEGGAGRGVGLDRDAVLADDLDLAQLFAVGIGNAGDDGDLVELRVTGVDDGTHDLFVQVVVDVEVLVLGRVHAALRHRAVDARLGEVVGQDDVTAGVGVAPLALVVILVVGRRDVPALGKALVVLGIARPVGAAADLAFAVADLDQAEDLVTHRGVAGVVVEGTEGRARMVELGNDRRVLDILGADAFLNRVAVDVQASVSVNHQVVVAVHAGVVGLVVQLAVVTGNNAPGVKGIGVAGAAGPRHLVAVGADEVGALLVVFERRLSCLFPLGLAVAHRQLGKIVVAVGGRSRGGVEVVGVVGDDQVVDVVGDHRVLVRVLQRTGAVRVLRGMGVDLAEVQAQARFADEEGPCHLRLLAVGTDDLDLYGMTALRHRSDRRIADLGRRNGRIDREAVDRHRDLRVLAAVRDSRGDRRTLILAGRRVGGRRDGDDQRFVLDVHGHGRGIGHAVFVLRLAAQGQLLRALEFLLGDRVAVLVAVLRRRGDLLRRAAVDRVGHRHAGDLGQLVQDNVKLIIHTEVGFLGIDVHLRVENVAQVLVVLDLEETHGEQLRAAVVGPAAEAVAEVLDADVVAAVLRGLVVEDVTAGHFLQLPPAVVVVQRIKIQRFVVVGLAVDDLVLGGTQVQALVLEGVIGAVDVHGEDQGAVADVELVAVQPGLDAGDARRGLVVGLRAEAHAGVVVVDNDLVAVFGLLARDGTLAHEAVEIRVSDLLVDFVELHREDRGVGRAVEAVGAEGGVVDLDGRRTGAVALGRALDVVAAVRLIDAPLGVGGLAVLEFKSIRRGAGQILAAAGKIIGAVAVIGEVEYTGAGVQLQVVVLLVGCSADAAGLAAGRLSTHRNAVFRIVDDECGLLRRDAFDRVAFIALLRRRIRQRRQHRENHHHNEQSGNESLKMLSHIVSSL